MRRTNRVLPLSIAAVGVAAIIGSSVSAAAAADGPYQRPGTNERVNTSSSGAQARQPLSEGDTGIGGSAISANGRYVAFSSAAPNLVPDDTNGTSDVFRRDRRTGKAIRVSVASDGSQAITQPLRPGSHVASISADGRYVAIVSWAVNLVPGDTNLAPDVFVHDVKTRRTTRVSVASNGAQSNGNSLGGSLSANGRFIAFWSQASNLVGDDTNGDTDVFVHDMKSGKTILASRSSTGVQGDGYSEGPSLSASGRYLAFTSNATNLIADNTLPTLCNCAAGDVYWRDLRTGKTQRVSVASDGAQASYAVFPTCTIAGVSICNSVGGYSGHIISGDGRYVTFHSVATNLVPNDTNYRPPGWGADIFVHDVRTGRTERASVDSYGRERSDRTFSSWHTVISSDGRHVVYGDWLPSGSPTAPCESASLPLGLGVADPSVCNDSFVYSRFAGVREPLTVASAGRKPKWGACSSFEKTARIVRPHTSGESMSADGRFVTFASSATNLVAGDTNNTCDIFVRDRGSSLGVGGFGGTGNGSAPGTGQNCVEGVCVPSTTAADATGDVSSPEADLLGAQVVPRPQLGGPYVRLDVARMATVAGAPAGGLLYGVAFTANGSPYEVRAQRVPGVDFDLQGGASFGLFRQDTATGLWSKVAALKGGYGTIGNSVVFAVPVSELGSDLRDVRAFTGVGSYLTGATRVLDTVRFSR